MYLKRIKQEKVLNLSIIHHISCFYVYVKPASDYSVICELF